MSISPGSISRLAGSQLDKAVQVLISAFFDDPLMKYLLPECDKRHSQLEIFFEANLKYAMMAGEIYTNDFLNGVAAWLFPGDNTRPRPEGKDDPRSQLGILLDRDTSVRLAGLTRTIAALHKDLAPERHWYLLFLGVGAGEQGKGIGGALIEPMLRLADERNLPCMLDTMNERNLEFYRRHGFVTGREERICGDGPNTWTMLRFPRRVP